MEFVLVFVACLLIGTVLLLVCAAASNSGTSTDEPLVQVNVGETVKNSCGSGNCKSSKCGKKQFPAMKKGSKFVINGRTAEKISDTMYQYTDTLEQLYWMARDLHYYQMMFEPTHAYESVDNGGKTESCSTPETTYVAPIVVPVHTPSYHSNTTPSYSAPSYSHSSHNSSSHSSHSSCGGSSSHSSCSGSSSSCSSSSCSGSSCGGGD